MWRRSGLLGMFLTLTLLVSLAVPAFAAVDPIPHSFYGTVTIGGLPAAVGTEITAVVAGGSGSYTTTVEGEYGDPPFDYLVVSGEIEGGALIKFYIDGAEAAEAAEFHGGRANERNLTIEVVPPVVTTNAATDITTESATLNGSLDSLGDYSLVNVSFEWGETPGALGQATSPPEEKTSLGAFSAGIIDLDSDTTYYFRAKATGSITVYGDALSFTTVEEGVTYDLTVASSAGGLVTEPGEGLFPDYAENAVVDLLAVPDALYRFVNWTDDVSTINDVNAADTFITMSGDYSITATFTEITGFTSTLFGGWNLLSTPVLLDADSDSMEQVFDAPSLANIEVIYSWDSVSGWAQVFGDYQLVPLEAIFVRVSSGALATANFTPSGEPSSPPSRELAAGLNLIGPAPAFDGAVFPAMPLDEALITIAEAPGGLTGYTMVISPGLNQPGWAYVGSEIKDLLPYKGYWVVMENGPDTMYGSSTTPIE